MNDSLIGGFGKLEDEPGPEGTLIVTKSLPYASKKPHVIHGI